MNTAGVKSVFFFLLLTSSLHAEPLPAQSLVKGESAVLKVDYEVGDVALTDPKVADFLIQEDRHQVYLNALKEGFTTLTLWDKSGSERDVIPVTVYNVSLKSLAEEARNTFGATPQVRIAVQDNTLLLQGEVPTPRDLERVRQFVGRYPQVISEVHLARASQATIAQTIQEAIAIPGIRVGQVRDRLVLQGVAYSEAQSHRAFEIAKLYQPDILNLIEVREADRRPGKMPMVKLNVYFMEIQKSALNTFGIQWAPGAMSTSTMGSFGSLVESAIGFVFNLLPKVRFVHEHGLGRVLEKPSLMVKSGDPAKFFSGIQIPYYAQQNVEFKEVGVRIEAEPIAAGGDVDIKITATLSSPSPHIEGGINTSTVSTTGYIRSGQAMVLGGLVSHREIKTYNRVPKDLVLASALFTLFLSKDFQKGDSEFLVFVEPEILEEAPLATAELENWTALQKEMTYEKGLQPARLQKNRGTKSKHHYDR